MELENTSKIPIKWVDISCLSLDSKHKSRFSIKFNDFSPHVPPGAKVIISGTVYVTSNEDQKEINTDYLLNIKYKGMNILAWPSTATFTPFLCKKIF